MEFCDANSESRSLQFAIRPTIRNHHSLTRDGVIKQLADVVGPAHKVDLKHYDLLILVEIYRVSGLRFSPSPLSIPSNCAFREKIAF